MLNSVSLTFPDGSVRDYEAAMTGAGLAESISKSLAKKAVAYAIDGVVRDLSDPSASPGRSRSSPARTRARWNSSATTQHTCWPRPCRNCGRERR
ncbi:hypothetical protein AJ88_34465 [Mesorhizobium amorphae CCBAU 01583]|nr:hypothetical protein AJ88_34465 [Mesorhizobium amorphae CCBAU 01583]